MFLTLLYGVSFLTKLISEKILQMLYYFYHEGVTLRTFSYFKSKYEKALEEKCVTFYLYMIMS